MRLGPSVLLCVSPLLARYGLEFLDVSPVVAGCTFRVFAGAVADGGCVKLIRVPDGKRISNSRLKPPKGDVVAEAVAAGELRRCNDIVIMFSRTALVLVDLWHLD